MAISKPCLLVGACALHPLSKASSLLILLDWSFQSFYSKFINEKRNIVANLFTPLLRIKYGSQYE